MQNYDNKPRGVPQSIEWLKQPILFDGMVFPGRSGYMNVSPTDIDGLIQLDIIDCFILFELKYKGDPSNGQAHAFESLVDAVSAGGKNAVLFIAEHNAKQNEVIYAKDSIVKEIYYEGRWVKQTKSTTLYERINNFITYLKEDKQK